jgi:hypothetical protein
MRTPSIMTKRDYETFIECFDALWSERQKLLSTNAVRAVSFPAEACTDDTGFRRRRNGQH